MKEFYVKPEVEIDDLTMDYDIITMSGGEDGTFDEFGEGDLD